LKAFCGEAGAQTPARLTKTGKVNCMSKLSQTNSGRQVAAAIGAVAIMVFIAGAPASAQAPAVSGLTEWTAAVPSHADAVTKKDERDVAHDIYQLLVRQQTQAGVTEQHVFALNTAELENKKVLLDILSELRQLRAQTKGSAQ
jgi:hypothetical protein